MSFNVPICLTPALIAAAFWVSAPPAAQAAKFPPLNPVPALAPRPGKLVWVDLFTTEPEKASAFYCQLLGWTAAGLEQKGKAYTIFSNGGRPVAGLAPRSANGKSHPSRWIGYYAVDDLAASVQAALEGGGVLRAPMRKVPDRGLQAIVADIDGVPIGLLQSSSGDPPDADTAPGDWNWFEFYATHPAATAAFCRKTMGLVSTPEPNSDRTSDLVLASGGEPRGGVAALPAGDDVKPSWLGVVRVADLDGTLARVAGLGGEILLAPHPLEFGSRFAIILDPTGGTLGLVQYLDGSNPAERP